MSCYFSLQPSAKSDQRDCAKSTRPIRRGSVILSLTPLATALSRDQKGRRCDLCLKLSESLSMCSKCRTTWYCNHHCQQRDWSARHKRICKKLLPLWEQQSVSSPELDVMDGLLMLHLLAEHYSTLYDAMSGQENPDSPASLLLHLLPGREDRSLGAAKLSQVAALSSWSMDLIQILLYAKWCSLL